MASSSQEIQPAPEQTFLDAVCDLENTSIMYFKSTDKRVVRTLETKRHFSALKRHAVELDKILKTRKTTSNDFVLLKSPGFHFMAALHDFDTDVMRHVMQLNKQDIEVEKSLFDSKPVDETEKQKRMREGRIAVFLRFGNAYKIVVKNLEINYENYPKSRLYVGSSEIWSRAQNVSKRLFAEQNSFVTVKFQIPCFGFAIAAANDIAPQVIRYAN